MNGELVDRVRRILLDPRREWAAIEAEEIEPEDLFRGYVLPLAAIGPVASIIGLALVGVPVPFLGTIRFPIWSAVLQALASYVLSLVGVYVVARVADLAAPTFGGRRDFTQAFKAVAFASTAAWVGGIANLVPAVAVLGVLFSLYSLYLLYLGLPGLMDIPRQHTLAYTAVVAVAGLVAFFLVHGIARMVLVSPGPAGGAQ